MNTHQERRYQTKDIAGMTFGKLTAQRPVQTPSRNHSRHIHWLCSCSCGRTSVTDGTKLRNGHTKSCGCLHTNSGRPPERHGHALSKSNGKRSPTYTSWQCMIQRCRTDLPLHARKDYADRGIKVCARWHTSFLAFLDDMGERPLGTSLDRINNDGGYEPGNCRWATEAMQKGNKSQVGSRREFEKRIAALEAEVMRLRQENENLRMQ